MKATILTLGALLMTTTLATAGGNHGGGHGHGTEEAQGTMMEMMEMMAAGMPGEKGQVTRTVNVDMLETQDGQMLFEPGELRFTQGETILFKVRNTGELDHEFVLDTYAKNMEHRDLMMKFPEMEHDDPNSVALAPGETGEIVWTFANSGYFHFACLIPGHMESGMHGPIAVAAN